jgi:signal transduction histidine kinase
LVDNAIKYSPDGSRVTIASATRGRSVHIDVTDKGRGIDERDLPHIFDRFYRADLSRSNSDVKGHGLGLSIAKQIADMMGGELSVTSRSGKGSTFTIKLDAAKPAALKPAVRS